MLSLLFLRVKAQQYFSLSCMSSDKKTLLKIWLNHGLKLTIFKGTGPRRNKKERLCKIRRAKKRCIIEDVQIANPYIS